MVVHYTVLSLLFTLFVLRRVTSSSSNCPAPCFCNTPSKIVYCSRRGLGRIPTGIPSDSVQLNLNGNVFQSSALQSSNFTGLDGLEHLYLSECGLEKIQVGTFVALKNLKWLDLSNNRIKSVSEFGFSGLTLQHLFLNGNRHIQLVADSFEGLLTTGLYLHDCSLSKLQPEVLVPLNASLKYLWLNGNEFDGFDDRFQSLFASMSHLRLGSNPLHCNCEVVWLKEFFDRNSEVFKGAIFPSCLSPQRLKGRLFNELSLSDFRCQAPMFNNIETTFGLSTGRLKCTASGDPAPTLYWIQPSGKTTRYAPPDDEEVKRSEGVLTVMSGAGGGISEGGAGGGEEDDSSSTLFGMYICIANNEAGNVTLTINVSWPLLGGPLNDVITTTTAATPIELTRQPSSQNNSQRIRFPIPSSTLSLSTNNNNNIRKDFVDASFTNRTHSGSNFGSNSSPGNDNRAPANNRVLPGDDRASPPGMSPGMSSDDRQNYTVLSDVELDQQGGQRRPRLFTATEFVCAIVGTHVATLVLCFLVIPLVCRTRWRRRLQEKERQQLHHQLHYSQQIQHPTYERQQQQRQPVASPAQAAGAGTFARNRPPIPIPPSTDHYERSPDESAYLNGIVGGGGGGGGQNNRHYRHPPPLYLTDYLLTPPK